MARYRTIPIEVEAVQLCWATWSEICDHFGTFFKNITVSNTENFSDDCGEKAGPYIQILIPTQYGNLMALHGDWIIRKSNGTFLPCTPEVFKRMYEEVPENKLRSIL